MKRRTLTFGIMLWAATATGASTQSVLKIEVNPSPISDTQVGQVVISTTAATELKGAVLSVEPPPGFKVEPQTVRYTGGTEIREVMTLQRIDPTALSGTRKLLVRLRNDTAVLATETVDLTYEDSTLSTSRYLWLGLLGVIIGYIVKLALKGLAAVPDPIPPVTESQRVTAEHWFVAFVRKHYLGVDFTLTMLIGFLVLLGTLTGVLPPAGTRWPAAVWTGAAIGVLANNELLGSLKRSR